jgi:anti-sigma factor RsiW
MNDCVSEVMRDALPDLIHGQLDEEKSAEVEAHVASCADCAAEIELLRLVVASAETAPAIDVARIAAAIPTPTRQGFLLHQGGGQSSTVAPAQRSRGIWSRTSLRIAATVVIVAAGGLSLLVGRDVLHPENQIGQSRPSVAPLNAPAEVTTTPAPVSPQTVAPENRAAEVAVVAGTGMSLVGEVQDLSDEHLATLLDDLEDMDAIPGEEPESVTPMVREPRTTGGIQ